MDNHIWNLAKQIRQSIDENPNTEPLWRRAAETGNISVMCMLSGLKASGVFRGEECLAYDIADAIQVDQNDDLLRLANDIVLYHNEENNNALCMLDTAAKMGLATLCLQFMNLNSYSFIEEGICIAIRIADIIVEYMEVQRQAQKEAIR